MYALVNTMNGSDRYLGRIVSQHRTAEAADAADVKLQRMVKRNNGESSYLPTTIVELTSKVDGKARLEVGQYRLVDRDGNSYT